MENGYRKSQDSLANKVSVKVASVKMHQDVLCPLFISHSELATINDLKKMETL